MLVLDSFPIQATAEYWIFCATHQVAITDLFYP